MTSGTFAISGGSRIIPDIPRKRRTAIAAEASAPEIIGPM
jgi:hypothetical protein